MRVPEVNSPASDEISQLDKGPLSHIHPLSCAETIDALDTIIAEKLGAALRSIFCGLLSGNLKQISLCYNTLWNRNRTIFNLFHLRVQLRIWASQKIGL